MNVLHPKKSFLEFEKTAADLRTIVRSPSFQMVLAYALATFVQESTPTSDQLIAVRSFITTLLNLPEQETVSAPPPIKTLDHSVYDSPHAIRPKTK